MNTKRISNYDLLRIMACLMVIIIHFSCLFLSDTSNPKQWLTTDLYDSFSRSCVPLFFMISGTFLLAENKLATPRIIFRRIIRLMLPLIFWEIIYYSRLLFAYGVYKDSILQFFHSLIAAQNHFWYIPTLMGIYLLLPALKQIAKNKEICQYYLIIWLIFGVTRNTLLLLAPIIEQSHHYTGEQINTLLTTFCYLELTSYAGYFILGFYLANYFKYKSKLPLLLLLTIASSLLCAGINYFTTYYLCHSPWVGMQNYMSATTCVEAICIFLIFKDHVSQINFTEKASNIISYLGSCTFGIYLMHPIFTEPFSSLMSSKATILMLPILSLLVFALCAIITYILKHIPILKRYIV